MEYLCSSLTEDRLTTRRPKSVLVVGRHSTAAIRHMPEGNWAVAGTSLPSEALEYLGSNPCDLLLCDLHLAGTSSVTLLSRMTRKHPEVTVVVCVEPANLRDAVLAMIAGAAGFVVTTQSPEFVSDCLSAAYENNQLAALRSQGRGT